MNPLNLVCLIPLLAVIAVCVAGKLYTRRILRDMDGFNGISTPGADGGRKIVARF